VRKLAFVVFLLLVCNRPVQAQAPYYQGKTVTIVVGTLAGDLYDLYAPAIALYIGKYIPGNPNVIVQTKLMGK
jgi:tripartite-type tricarboxylate transporter receptor subunit TctC